MADITEQATQDELADSLVAEPEPEAPPQEIPTEEAQPEITEEAEQAEEQTEEEADWLPNEQEKVFPDEVLAKYATRYNVDLAKADPQLRQLIVDKINSDIYLRTLQQQQQEEPEEQFEPEPEPQPEPTQPAQTREQYFQNLTNVVKERTDPQVAQEFYGQFMKAFGVPDAEIASLAPQQAMAFTQTASIYMLNLMNTFADDLISAKLGQHIEQTYPQFGEMYQVSSAARTWDSVRNELQNESLPAYGTREYSAAARQIGAEIAGSSERFESMVFTGRNGQPLSQKENLAEKQRMIAERMIQGTQEPQIPPAVMAQAVQTGQKIAQRKAAQQSAGNLGAGKSKPQIAQSADDDYFTEGLELYQKQHGSL